MTRQELEELRRLDALEAKAAKAASAAQPAGPSLGQNFMQGTGPFAPVAAFGRGIADSLTFGADDEIGSAIKSALTGTDYNQNLENYRSVVGNDLENQKGARLAGGITGAVAPMFVPGGAAVFAPVSNMQKVQQAGNAAKLGANVADNVIVGAAHGFGAGEGGDRLSNAAGEGSIGVLTGLAGPAIARGLKGVADFVGNAGEAVFNPTGRAGTVLANKVQSVDIQPEEILSRAQNAVTQGQDAATVGSLVGGDAADLPALSVRAGGKGATKVRDYMGARQQAAPERVAGFIDENIAPGSGGREAFDRMQNSRKAASNAAYKAAYQNTIPYDEQLDNILRSNPNELAAAERVHAQKASNARASGEAQDPMFVTVLGKNGKKQRWLTAEGFDSFLRSVQGSVDRSYAPGGDAQLGEQLKVTRDILAKRIGDLNPEFAQARDIYSSGRAVEDAMEGGRAAAKTSAKPQDVLADNTALKTSGEKEAAKLGFAWGLNDQVGQGVNFNPRGLQTPNVQSKIRVFAPEGADQLNQRLSLEAAMSDEARGALSALPRANPLAQDNMVNPATMAATASGSFPAILGALGGFGQRTAAMLGPEANEMLSKYLTTSAGVDGSINPAFIEMVDTIAKKISGAQQAEALTKAAGRAGGRTMQTIQQQSRQEKQLNDPLVTVRPSRAE